MPTIEHPRVAHRRVVVVGAGFSGVAAASALDADLVDFVVLGSGNHDVGGVWRDDRRDDTARVGAAIRRVVHERGLLDRFRFGQSVLDARWDRDCQRWTVRTPHLTLTADVLVDATGRPDSRLCEALPRYVRLGDLSRGAVPGSLSRTMLTYRRVLRHHLAACRPPAASSVARRLVAAAS